MRFSHPRNWSQRQKRIGAVGAGVASVAVIGAGALFGSGSGGSIDVFVGSTPTPIPASRTLDCYETATTPHLCGFPDSTNTGIQSGHTLTSVPTTGSSGGAGWTSSSGNVSICGTSCTSPGTSSSTVSDLQVGLNKSISVDASNVTINNVKVLGQSGQTTANEFTAIEVAPSAHNVTIEYCELIGNSTSPTSGAHAEDNTWVNRGSAGLKIGSSTLDDGGYGVTMRYCNVHGFFGPIWNYREKAGGQVRISHNYIHGVECWGGNNGVNRKCSLEYPTNGSANTDHCNNYGQSNASGLTAGGTQSVLIDNNTLVNEFPNCATGIADADSDNAQTFNLQWVVEHNLIGYMNDIGSNCLVPGRTGGSGKVSGAPSYVAVSNNHIFNCSPWLYDGPSLVGTGVGKSPNNVECGNLYDNGPRPGKSTDSYPWWDDTNAANYPNPTTCTAPSWVSSVPGWDPTNP